MTDVDITVRGTHSVTVPPEQGTVHAVVSADGPEPEPVVHVVATVLADVAASLEQRHDPERGPVIRYVIDQVRKGAHRPYNQDGRQLPPVHTAVASVTATFTDFGELASWVDRVAGLGGVGISHIEWALTEPTRHAVEREIRQEAVRDARRRAQDYADALNLGTVQVRSISDTGLSGPGQARVMMARAMSDAPGRPPEIGLRPDDLEIQAQVEAGFVVSTRDRAGAN